MIDLEMFPTSPAAKRMLKTVSPIYDHAYVGKWIYQVMGLEIDEAWEFFKELRLQAFPETATWGIAYWEQRYHIAPDNSLTLDERRQRVIIKRGKRKPMNPARMEQFVRAVVQRNIWVEERNEEYSFYVYIYPGETQVDYQGLITIIRSVKPSHLTPVVLFETEVKLSIQADSQEKYHFAYTIAGTVPDINTVGALRRENITLAADMERHPLPYPIAGVNKAGENPDINMVGTLGRNIFMLEAEVERHKHEYPTAGTGAAGEEPDTNMAGGISRNELTIEAEIDGYKHGHRITGTVPDINTVGALRRENITLAADMERHPLPYPMTGVKPDINTAGKTEGGSLLPSISAEGSVFDYQLCGEDDEV